MRYTVGLDIGITSVGWCVVREDGGLQPKIADLGVRVFPKGEKQNGEPCSLKRRLARSARRMTRRRRSRLDEIRGLILEANLCATPEALSELLAAPHERTPYALRSEGLDRRLKPEEWVCVLYHLARRRGFKSNRKNVELADKQSEEGALLGGVGANETLLQGYRTVGEMMEKDPKFAEHKRNKGQDYSCSVSRGMLLREIELLFEAQRSFDNPHASSVFQERYTAVWAFQRPFALGNQIEKMTGACTLLPDQKRAPAASATAEHFRLLSAMANLRIFSARKGTEPELSQTEREKLAARAYAKEKVTYADVRAALELDESFFFRAVRYGRGDETNERAEGKAVFISLKGYHELRKAVQKQLGKPAWEALAAAPSQIDAIAHALTFYKTDDEVGASLAAAGLPAEFVAAVSAVSFRGVMNLSNEAMRRLIPFMEKGDRYDEACRKAGFAHYAPQKVERSVKLPPLESEALRNPVVVRALTQTRKVLNAIVDRYGTPTRVCVELARDLSRPFDERQRIEREQKKNREENERACREIQDTFRYPNASGGDRLKFRLWKDQQAQCAYSQSPIESVRLFEPGYAEVDHILPYSRSLDDGYVNKALVLADENRNKGNRTPYEYMGTNAGRWEAFEAWTRATIRNPKKRANLLRESFSDEDAAEMTERNLCDTRGVTRLAAQWIRTHLRFADETVKSPVLCVNGRMTSLLRGRWGLAKNREEGGKHHALDAAVVAACTHAMVQKISEYSRRKELHRLQRHDERFPEPWPGFRHELLTLLADDPMACVRENKVTLPHYTPEELAALRPIFVSRPPRRKATGAGHEETIRSVKDRGPESVGKTAQRVNLGELTLPKLEKMVGKDRDVRLYEALKQRLIEFDGKGDRAFAEPFYKPTRDGSRGPLVRTLKLYETGRSGVAVRGGVAKNGDMVRVDVYRKGRNHYLVPHYVDDIAQGRLKKRAIVAYKPESEWTPIDDTFTFCFSLFKDDVVRVVSRSKEYWGYYNGTHRRTGAVNIEAHDSSEVWEGIGVKTCALFEKYQVGVLGDRNRVTRERPPQGRY